MEDRLQYQHRCCHADPILQGRDAQRPGLTIGLWYEHSSDRVRLVSLLSERKRQFTKPPFHPIRPIIREILPVHTRCALVGAALSIGMRQDVFPVYLVVQGIEAEARLSLRFRVYVCPLGRVNGVAASVLELQCVHQKWRKLTH